MDDLKLVKAEIERIRHHLDLNKKATEENTQLLVDIKTTLVGNHLNEGGMVREQRRIKEDVEDLQDFKKEVTVYIRQAKYFLGIIIGAIVTITIKIFSK
jgi:propanediol dehydratase large subunit